MEEKRQTHEFKTEVRQVLNLIVNSLYSNPDIFLRELISNASDAIDRLRFKAHTEPDILGDDSTFKIKIRPDGIAQTIEIIDNGIGMTHEEVMENIGTIAKSGTAGFLEMLKQAQDADALTPELIGQFGVGFYSAFMVADKITLVTRAAGAPPDQAVRWESSGDGTYSIEPTRRDRRGTSITLHLKKQGKEDTDYTDQWQIRRIVKQHSDYVAYPIVMDVEKEVPIPDNEIIKDKDGKPIGETKQRVIEEETLNSMKAIWTQPKDAVDDKTHEEFYKHLAHDWSPPLARLHLKFEGTTEYDALLYIPSKAPFDLFQPERRHGIQLYCKRVFIMEDCKALIPEYLRFVKGVVDAPDLNLNVSREMLQQDRLVINIRNNLVKKVLELLKDMPAEDYEIFYEQFGAVLKEGIYSDTNKRTALAALARYKTTRSEDKWVSLDEYVQRMQPDQKDIYFITGDDMNALINSPHLETLKAKSYEVLLMVDPVDEWVMQVLTEYDGKLLKNAEKGDLELDKVDDTRKEAFNALFGFIKGQLAPKVKEVKASARLKDSVACLSGDAYDMSAYMEKLLKAAGQKPPEVQRVLELNMSHPVMDKIKSLYEKDRDNAALKDYSRMLYDLALIAEGGKLDNPGRFSRLVGEVMTRAIE